MSNFYLSVHAAQVTLDSLAGKSRSINFGLHVSAGVFNRLEREYVGTKFQLLCFFSRSALDLCGPSIVTEIYIGGPTP